MNFVCQHSPSQCIQISYRNIRKCLTNAHPLTTIADIQQLFLDELPEHHDLTVNDCCLYLDDCSFLHPLKSTDFICDIRTRYSLANIRLRFSFKRTSSPSRFAQRKKLDRITASSTNNVDPYEQIRLQELLIQKQQEIIHRLTSRHDPQVRFRLPANTTDRTTSVAQVKSILKKSSSIDRDIDQLISLKLTDDAYYSSDDDESTTDSCLGSLSSADSGCYSLSQQQLETLV